MITLGFVCGIISAFVSAYTPLLFLSITQILVDDNNDNNDNIHKYIYQYIMYKIIVNLFASLRGCFFTIYIHKLTSERKNKILQRFSCFDILYFDPKNISENISVISHHCEKVSELYMLNGNVFVRTVTQIVSIIYVIYTLSFKMFYFTIMICSVNVTIQHIYHEYFYNKAIKSKNEKTVEQNKLVTDYITRIDIYRACGLDNKMHSLFSLYQKDIDNSKFIEAIHYSINLFISQSMNSLCFCSCILYGLYIELQYKEIHTFVMYMDNIIGIVDSIKNMYNHISHNYNSIEKINEVNKGKEIREWGNILIPNMKPTIYINNISFRYNDKTDVIRNMSNIFLYGDKVGISACSGKGKSTFLQLILGLYSPYSGNIKYDDIDMYKFDRDWFYQHMISYVGQEPLMLYYGNYVSNELLDNYGEFTKDIPRNSLAELSNISGGQKQRLCICNALFKKTSILVLDEPSASLDKKNEDLLANLLIKDKRTQIIVSHNIDFLKKTCDRIEYW